MRIDLVVWKGKIIDITIGYSGSYIKQMLRYGREFWVL